MKGSGKVALVTGGAKGIGEAVVRRLAEAGASVAVTDVDAPAGRATADAAATTGVRAEFFALDVADAAACRATVDSVVRAFGRLDLLVNNAGVFPFSPALQTPPDLWDRVQAINLRGPFFLSTAAAPHLAKSGGGAIVNVASIDAVRPTGNLAHYDASKAALLMLTRSLALEFAPLRIRVNAVLPGSVDTPGARSAKGGGSKVPPALLEVFLKRIPMGRMGSPDDIARVVLFLASQLSSYMTGAGVVVDGGYLIA